ncbi:hypothetical protein RA167_00820 [Mycetohabitans endofungorum]|uniref:hypothetical protein n=1 Tax=Mycetohabitans endofungorum TaxID=417203 RepID=UPI0030CC49F9
MWNSFKAGSRASGAGQDLSRAFPPILGRLAQYQGVRTRGGADMTQRARTMLAQEARHK